MKSAVSKAVFPVAGLGTRFLPATKASPKEMLPVVDKPLIQYAVEEAYSAGIREMVFVTGRNKRSIEDHFDVAYELENELEASGKIELKRILDEITPNDMKCVYIRQPRPLGLGNAVLCAESVIGDEPFAVILADELAIARKPPLVQLMEVFYNHKKSVVGLKTVPEEHISNYGIASGRELEGSLLIEVDRLIEKPVSNTIKSTSAISGRYILFPEIFKALKNQKPGHSGEIQLTDALSELVRDNGLLGLTYEGNTFDCGSKLGLLQANVALGLEHEETKHEFRFWLKRQAGL